MILWVQATYPYKYIIIDKATTLTLRYSPTLCTGKPAGSYSKYVIVHKLRNDEIKKCLEIPIF